MPPEQYKTFDEAQKDFDQRGADNLLEGRLWNLFCDLEIFDLHSIEKTLRWLDAHERELKQAAERDHAGPGIIKKIPLLLSRLSDPQLKVAGYAEEQGAQLLPKECRLLGRQLKERLNRMALSLGAATERFLARQTMSELDVLVLYLQTLKTSENTALRDGLLQKITSSPHLEALSSGLAHPEDMLQYIGMLGAIISECADSPKIQPLKELFLNFAKRSTQLPDFDVVLRWLAKNFSAWDVEEILLEALKPYGALAATLIKAWLPNEDTLASNFQALRELEAQSPGICEFLLKEFGIVHYGRYPLKLLLEQRQQFENVDSPYGIILYPYSDHNGAFHGSKYAIENLFKALQDKLLLRIVESGSKIGVARALLKLDRRYHHTNDEEHKISFGIIGGHGTRTNIQFGEGDESGALGLEDLLGKGAQRGASQFFKKGATIILSSCSTGESGGVAERLSQLIEGRVIAPDRPIATREYSVGGGGNGRPFRFNARYNDEDARREYVNGVKINKPRPLQRLRQNIDSQPLANTKR